MPFPVLSTNLAKSVKARNWFKGEIAPLMRHTRDEKNGVLREQWLRYRRMWTLRGTEQAYHGRQRMYLPLAHRILENWVQKLKADLFPQSGKWFSNEPNATADEERGTIIQSLFMRHMLDPNGANLRGRFPPLLRNLGIYGTGIASVGWRHLERLVPTLDRVGKGSMARVEEVERRIVQYLGPTFRSVDPFLFYVYPATCQFTNEATLLFEDMLIEWADLVRMGDTPIDPAHDDLGMQVENLAPVKKARKDAERSFGTTSTGKDRVRDPDHFAAEQQRLAERGLKGRSDTATLDPGRPMDLTKFAWHGRCPEDEADDGIATWYQGLTCGADELIQLRRNPNWSQHPGWLAAKFSELDDEFWGYGIMFLLDHLQYFTNDVLNQTGDGLVLSLNPIVAMDFNAIQYPDSIKYAPGARWLLRDPGSSVNMLEPPKETAMTGINAINFLSATANDITNVAPSSAATLQQPGRARGRAVNTATGMSILASEALLQVREVEESIESGILTPMLPIWQSLYQQCLDRDLALRLEGADGGLMVERYVSRDDLLGTYQWAWIGSTFTFNQNVKSQHILNYIQLAAKIPPELLAAEGIKIGWKYLLRSAWGTIYGDREANKVVTDAEPTRVVDPEIENDLFRLGRGAEVTVSRNDEDMQHAQSHALVLQDPHVDPAIKEQVLQHIQKHAASAVMKQMQQQQKQQAMAMQQAALAQGGGAGPGGGVPGGGQGGGPGAPRSGPPGSPSSSPNGGPPGRMPQTMGEDDVQRRMSRMQ